MALDDARSFVSWVAESGLIKTGCAIELAVVCPDMGNFPAPDWLLFGNIQGYRAACLAGMEPGDLFIPEPELRLHSKKVLLRDKELEALYDFLGTNDNNVEVYRHKETGQHLYIGRTRGPTQEATNHDPIPEQTPGIESAPHYPARKWWQFWK